jgi:ABC-type nitrate/sulfonate/bicarbonate transport system substrate-binding protein/ActR/RegA family two-component response regulator
MEFDVNMKILIVEDAKVVRKMAIKILTEIGFTSILEAADGQIATQILSDNSDINLIISDWNMPNKDGFSLLQWVRKNKDFDHIPFIMATAQGEKKQIDKAIQAGANSFITKPFGVPEMRAIIEKTFQGEAESEQPAPQRIDYSQRMQKGKLEINAAHIQITDHLTLGVLDNMMKSGKMKSDYFSLNTHCMTSWNPVLQSLEQGQVDVAFVLAPIAMDLFSAGVPIRLILFAHKDGSISVRNKSFPIQSRHIDYFRNKLFYIPHLLSIHHMLAHMFFKEIGLHPGLSGTDKKVDLFFEVAPPIKMTQFMSENTDTCGFMVAEPIGSKAIAADKANLLFHSNDIWEYHPCCVVAMREELIESHPDAVHDFVRLLVESGDYISAHPDHAAEIAVSFLDPKKLLGLKQPILSRVLSGRNAVKTNDLFPELEPLDHIQRYMHSNMGIGTIIDLEKFVDTSFAESVFKDRQTERTPSADIEITKGVNRVLTELPTGKIGAATQEQFQTNKNLMLNLSKVIVNEVLPLSLNQCIPLVNELVQLIDNHTKPIKNNDSPLPEQYIRPMIYAIYQILLAEGCKAETGKLAITRTTSIASHADFHLVDVRTHPAGYDILMANVKGQNFFSLYCCLLIKFLFQKNVRNRKSPETFFESLNKQLISSNVPANHVSANYLHLNFNKGSGNTIIAGHPPVILMKHSLPMVRAIMGESFLLGEIANQQFSGQIFDFRPKDRLFLHSMSVVNAAPAGSKNKKNKLDFIGLDDILMSNRDKSLEKMLEALLIDILSHCKNAPADGMMILGVEVP